MAAIDSGEIFSWRMNLVHEFARGLGGTSRVVSSLNDKVRNLQVQAACSGVEFKGIRQQLLKADGMSCGISGRGIGGAEVGRRGARRLVGRTQEAEHLADIIPVWSGVGKRGGPFKVGLELGHV